AELERAEQPILKDLRAVGINVERVWGLLSLERPYPEAIPILLEHLQKPYPDRVLEAIGRALGVPEAREHWDFLVERFKVAPNDTNAKMGLGDALQLIAGIDKSLLDDIIALVRDPAQGPDRLMLIPVLSKSRDPRAYETLVEMRDDPDLYKEIAYRLKRKKAPPGSRH
ncbi:MAG: hypothetical protein KC431_19105, partial [Myxococcales bacterium]|nr:hypothetical protein [Myxococcales bacterium]